MSPPPPSLRNVRRTPRQRAATRLQATRSRSSAASRKGAPRRAWRGERPWARRPRPIPRRWCRRKASGPSRWHGACRKACSVCQPWSRPPRIAPRLLVSYKIAIPVRPHLARKDGAGQALARRPRRFCVRGDGNVSAGRSIRRVSIPTRGEDRYERHGQARPAPPENAEASGPRCRDRLCRAYGYWSRSGQGVELEPAEPPEQTLADEPSVAAEPPAPPPMVRCALRALAPAAAWQT